MNTIYIQYCSVITRLRKLSKSNGAVRIESGLGKSNRTIQIKYVFQHCHPIMVRFKSDDINRTTRTIQIHFLIIIDPLINSF